MILSTLSLALSLTVVMAECDPNHNEDDCNMMGCGFVEGSGGDFCLGCAELPPDVCGVTPGCVVLEIGGACGECKDVLDETSCNATPGCVFSEACMTQCEDPSFIDICIDTYVAAGGCDIPEEGDSEELDSKFGAILGKVPEECFLCENIGQKAQEACADQPVFRCDEWVLYKENYNCRSGEDGFRKTGPFFKYDVTKCQEQCKKDGLPYMGLWKTGKKGCHCWETCKGEPTPGKNVVYMCTATPTSEPIEAPTESSTACDETDNFSVPGETECCPASRTRWDSTYTNAEECCVTEITNMDGSCSDPEPPTEPPVETPTESPTVPCSSMTRGQLCGRRPECWWNKKSKVCIDLACENATSRKICLGHFLDDGLKCAMVDNACVDYDPEVCAHKLKAECIASDECEFNRVTEECVDKGGVPCTDYTKASECIHADPTSAPLGCHFNKKTKTCTNLECSMKTKKNGCRKLGCNWNGKVCSDPI